MAGVEETHSPTTPNKANSSKMDESKGNLVSFVVKGRVFDVPSKWVRRSGYLTMLTRHTCSGPIPTDSELEVFDFVLALSIVAKGKYPCLYQSELRPLRFHNHLDLCEYFLIDGVVEDEDNEEIDEFKQFMKGYLTDISLDRIPLDACQEPDVNSSHYVEEDDEEDYEEDYSCGEDIPARYGQIPVYVGEQEYD